MSTLDPTVFVVEDEPETRASFGALVSSLGFAVETFGSGEELLQSLDVSRPGCVVVDFRLEGIDGIELQHRLRQSGWDIPVILISAFLNVQTTVRAMEQGFFRVLEKPYHDDALANAVQDAIQQDLSLRTQKESRNDFEQRLKSLDAREQCTLELIVSGHPNKAIERKLGLSTRTVDRIRSSILEKMDFLSFVELSAAYGAARTSRLQDPHAEIPETANGGESASFARAGGEPAVRPIASATDDPNWQLLCCDLHDGVVQYLVAGLLRVRAAMAQQDATGEKERSLSEAELLLSAALAEIRDIIDGRSPALPMQFGLVPAVEALCQELVYPRGIEVEFRENLRGQPIPSALEASAYRICQECLNNAVRHSSTERLRVELTCEAGTLRLSVRDWGRGFELNAVTADQRGLRGIRRRAQLLGGKASIQSRPGWGTLVTVELPVPSP